MKIQAASAVAPVSPHRRSMELIAQGLADDVFGKIHMDQVQICPQHAGYIGDDLVEHLIKTYPQTEFRLHASPKLKGQTRKIVHVSNASENMDYFRRVDEINVRFGAKGYSIHAGKRSECDLTGMLEQLDMIQENSDTPVAVEGLYPTKKDLWLMATWGEYETVAERGYSYALDLSHLNIVAEVEGRNDSLVRDLLSSTQCMEVHVSANDGRADSHRPMEAQALPWWMDLLDHANPEAITFYEGVLVDPAERRKKTIRR